MDVNASQSNAPRRDLLSYYHGWRPLQEQQPHLTLATRPSEDKTYLVFNPRARRARTKPFPSRPPWYKRSIFPPTHSQQWLSLAHRVSLDNLTMLSDSDSDVSSLSTCPSLSTDPSNIDQENADHEHGYCFCTGGDAD